MTGASSRDAYRPKEVCARLGITKSTLYRWLDQGKLTSVKIGGCTFIEVAELDRLMAASTVLH